MESRCGDCHWFNWQWRDGDNLVGECNWPIPLAFSVVLEYRRMVYENEAKCPCFRGKQL